MPILVRLIRRYLWPMAPVVLVALVCMFATTVLRMILPAAIRWGVDALDPSVPAATARLTLWWTAAVIIGSTVARGLTQFGQMSLSGRIGQRSVYRIRQDLYEHMQSLPFSFFDSAQTGELMSRATADIERLRMFLGTGAMN
ncbi:MAG TPA: ABC transporter transmembrane domain-containing protein, partial [Limnochordia bacterium]